MLDAAAALWLNNGALTFRPWSDERTTLLEENLVPFDMWECIDAMVGLALGEPALGAPFEVADGPGKSVMYTSPSWATTLELRARICDSTVHTAFSCKRMLIRGDVTLMLKK